jgi:hypothetical protein
LPFGIAEIEDQILTVAVAQLVKPLLYKHGVLIAGEAEISNAVGLCRLLSVQRRRKRRAANNRHEVAPPHGFPAPRRRLRQSAERYHNSELGARPRHSSFAATSAQGHFRPGPTSSRSSPSALRRSLPKKNGEALKPTRRAITGSFDDLIGGREELIRNGEAERLYGLEVDN